MKRLIVVLICMSLVLGLVPIPLRMPVARAAAVPSVALSIPSETMIGESVTFTATFDNTSGDTGYGPFIDLVFPYNGMDGAHGTATPDGMSFVSATYLGASVTATTLTFPDDDGAGAGTTGHVLHP
ncbi:MAG TPA: hypothetical protein VN478_06790, partial [Clostridia bacterium]|nr:hypothetical protein [Clostridia bacterium]